MKKLSTLIVVGLFCALAFYFSMGTAFAQCPNGQCSLNPYLPAIPEVTYEYSPAPCAPVDDVARATVLCEQECYPAYSYYNVVASRRVHVSSVQSASENRCCRSCCCGRQAGYYPLRAATAVGRFFRSCGQCRGGCCSF